MPRAREPLAQPALACRLTPPGEGGISLIELTGSRAAEILDRLFTSPRRRRASAMRPGRLLYGRLLKEGETLDEVILDCVRRHPRPIFMINCHGGGVAAARVMRTLADEGAVPCSIEERTQAMRAEGGLDAIQAEASDALPRAPTLTAAAHLLDQREGALTAAVAELRQAAERGDWASVTRGTDRLLAAAPFGRALLTPPRLVIAGRPNVGKSTLANTLLRHDRMIVHHLPGTTRDTVEELVCIGGLPFILADTAGLRLAGDAVEREGVERARRALRLADIAILLFDASQPLQPEDLRLLSADLPPRLLPVLNKCDLPRAIEADAVRKSIPCEPAEISALGAEGIDALEQRIVRATWPIRPSPGDPLPFTERQELLLRAARSAAESRDPERLVSSLTALLH